MNIGQTVTNSTDCKVYARTTAESVKIAAKTSTPPRLEDGQQESDSQGRGRTKVRGGAYLFLPGLQALRLLANS